MLKIKNPNQGQALMMVVLIMFVGLQMVVITFMNSLADLRLSTMEDQSERAFNASEAGIEDLLALNESDIDTYVGVGETDMPGSVDGLDPRANVGGNEYYKYQIKQNDTGEVQLAGNLGVSTVDIYWTNTSSNSEHNTGDACYGSGLLIEKWTNNAGTINVNRYNFPPSGCNNDPYVGWSGSTSGNDAYYGLDLIGNFQSKLNTSIAVTNNDIMLRIRPINNMATIYVVGNGGTMPLQVHNITSSASTNTGESRALQVVRTVPQLPSIFDYVLFSGKNPIVKD